MRAPPLVDVVVLSRTRAPLPPRVADSLAAQRGVRLRVHRVTGVSLPTDRNRWQTIARARNLGKTLGMAAWVMFLDDDVVLSGNCVEQLLSGLWQRPAYGALAADYLGDMSRANSRGHVGMGATLFRRGALECVQFRWQADRCECQCCCDDLRAQDIGIAYLASARASHTTRAASSQRVCSSEAATAQARPPSSIQPRILAAFDRSHYDRFRRQFLSSLRRAGNRERVCVVGYGLYPSQRQSLAALPDVEVWPMAENGIMPPIRRLRDFQQVVAQLPLDTPVAYWDAGDVIFQSRLDQLWQEVERRPQKLLAVREPSGHPRNLAVASWTLSIQDPSARRQAFQLLSRRPFLNSGFAAGTAGTLLRYFSTADVLRRSPALAGSSDWGDQTALNFYCHSNPGEWHEVDDGWNYCLHDRRRGEVTVTGDGRFYRRGAKPIQVVHGNAQSLARYLLAL